jgi:[ribosomal protein S5]-alanine N-acetyltransferase
VQKPLYTSSLILRPCAEADIDLLHSHWTEPEVRRYLWDGQVIDTETVREVINSSLESSQKYGYGLWVLLGKLDRDFRGVCALRAEPPARPELLYSVPARYWGSGIATESARTVLHYAFEELGLAFVSATVDKPNIASVRILEKLGFYVIDEKLVHGNWIVSYEISLESLLL